MLSTITTLLPLLYAQTTTVSLRFNPYAIVALFLLLAALFFAVWNRLLRRRVAERTRDLEEKAEALEEALRTQRTLETRQRQLLAAVEGSTDYIGIADVNGYALYANKAGRRMLGIGDDEDISNQHIADSHPRRLHKRLQEELLPTLKKEGIWLGESTFLARNGREIPVSQLVLAHKNEAGDIEYFSTVARDVTQRKQAEVAFQEIQRTLVTLMSNLPGMAYRCRNDKDWTMEFVSGGARDLTGYEPFALINNRVAAYNDLIHEEDQAMVWDTVQAAVAKKMPFRVNYRIRTRNSEERWVWEQGRGVFNAEGALQAIEGFVTDMTERRIAESALRDSEERFRFLADNLPGVIYLCKNDERYTTEYVNDAIADLVGYPKQDFLSDRVCIAELFHPEDKDRIVQTIDAALEKRDRYHVVYRLRHRSGEWRWVEEFGTGVFRDDELVFLEGFLSDVTERRQIEEVLVQSEKMLVVAGLAAGMAHEINNPISAILQARQNIHRRLSGELPANLKAAENAGISLDAMDHYLRDRKIHGFLDEVQDGAERTARIVTDLLNFSRSDTLRRAEVNVEDTAARAARLMRTEWSARDATAEQKINIAINATPNLPMVVCDDNKIEQVLLNLLRNAAQALAGAENLPNPNITVDIGFNEAWVEIAVRDNGPGIAEAAQKRIFEPFFTTKEVGDGTGLGLSVSYFLVVDQHNGKLEVESTPGEGACFTLSLPR